MLNVSERHASRAFEQHRSTQRKLPRGRDDEPALVTELIDLARTYTTELVKVAGATN